VFILTSICAVKKIWKKNFFRPTDPNFLACVTGNIDLFLGLVPFQKISLILPTQALKHSTYQQILVDCNEIITLMEIMTKFAQRFGEWDKDEHDQTLIYAVFIRKTLQ
jgi:hypothetical protein